MCDLPKLPTDKLYDEKFVLFVRTTPDGVTVLEERVVSRAFPYHAEIVEAVEEPSTTRTTGGRWSGGGILTVDTLSEAGAHVWPLGLVRRTACRCGAAVSGKTLSAARVDGRGARHRLHSRLTNSIEFLFS
jgi:hypothetical protein